jgi:hypothetical protein
MADSRKSYTVTINGLEHTMLLAAEDAERYGDAAVEVKESAKPANKSRTAENK